MGPGPVWPSGVCRRTPTMFIMDSILAITNYVIKLLTVSEPEPHYNPLFPLAPAPTVAGCMSNNNH